MGVLEIESRHRFLLKGMKLARATPPKVFSRASRLSLRAPRKAGGDVETPADTASQVWAGAGDGPPQSSALNSAPSPEGRPPPRELLPRVTMTRLCHQAGHNHNHDRVQESPQEPFTGRREDTKELASHCLSSN